VSVQAYKSVALVHASVVRGSVSKDGSTSAPHCNEVLMPED